MPTAATATNANRVHCTVNQHAPSQWFSTTTADCTGKQLCPSYTISQLTGSATHLSHVALQCDMPKSENQLVGPTPGV
jgi:hypothetical protein